MTFVPEMQNSYLQQPYKKYSCPDCGKGLSHTFTLDRHRRTVCGKVRNTNGKWKCNFCTRRYESVGSLSRHSKYECRVEPQFHCVFCDSKFTQRCSLTRHLKKKHRESTSDSVSPKSMYSSK
ncbi:hypothetical protein P5V15_004091 [Pogonomyrmex californicus]